MFAHSIKNFVERYSSNGIELPKGFPSPSSTDCKIMHLSKVHDKQGNAAQGIFNVSSK